MSKPFKIYKITNLTTNEGYIGYGKNASDRIREHLNRCKRNGSRLLRTAIAMFGDEHFTAAIIDEVETKEEAIQKRNEYIKKFHTSMPFGYNQKVKGWNVDQKARIQGSSNHSSKLTEEKVKSILGDTRMQKDIAKDYGVSEATISKIKRGKGWGHLVL